MRARILQPDEKGITTAADALKKGELVAMPTETVYGLAGQALNDSALARIFATKERPTFDQLIVHVASKDLSRLVDFSKLGPLALKRLTLLADKFWPGPLTLVL